ncbi:hypothetical protein ACIQZD_16750 [Peribacillus sp. NPDC096447]|uniref:hypothetical protein n=1 Tax=Peribacillus sp. NPDC096447 TaxID=3364394 RepID=UPI00380005DD
MIGQVTSQTFADMFHAKEALQSFNYPKQDNGCGLYQNYYAYIPSNWYSAC